MLFAARMIRLGRPMTKITEPCQFLRWDSDFFGFRIARVYDRHLRATDLETIFAWCDSKSVDCLYFLADSDDASTIRLVEEYGFHLVEIRITYEGRLKNWHPETRPKANELLIIRDVQPEEIGILQEIAKNSYKDSRWYFDPRFNEKICQAYFQTWIKNSAEGNADFVLVAELEGELLGYISGNRDRHKPTGTFELTAVKEVSRGLGIGHELFASGLDWYLREGVDRIFVNTQGRNIPTQRMIQRHGFISMSVQLYYHKWFAEQSPTNS
jgi:dTDP-4-amino-4,6-dideoxy-D-galactose acyltransferase